MTTEVRFPDGTSVRASSLPDRRADDEWRDFGLYADEKWAPSWPAEVIEWEDFGIPARFVEAAEQIHRAFDRARTGEHVEIGCAGGVGRTGTILACMVVLAGWPKSKAVKWVRTNYSPYAVEGVDQERWVERFADYLQGGAAPKD